MDPIGSNCPICFESLNDKIVGCPEVCDHKFCLPCLVKWTREENICPVDRQRFRKITSGDKVIPVKRKRKKKGSQLYDVSVYCDICNDKENIATVILCDSCDRAFHCACLKPPLKSIPQGSWHCPECHLVTLKLNAKKKKREDKIHSDDPFVYSKQSTSGLHPDLTASTKQTNSPLREEKGVDNSIDQNTSLNSTITEHNYAKQSHLSDEDSPPTETVNMPFNCTDSPSGDFEDFFNICDDDVVLTKRELLNSEEKSCDKRTRKKCRTNSKVNVKRLHHVKNTACNDFKMQTGRRANRLAAAIARKKMIKYLKKDKAEDSAEDSSYSAGQYSAAENASLNTDNPFADIKKSVLSHQSSVFSFNKNAMNYMKKISLSKPKSMNEMGLEGTKAKNTRMENLKKIAASKSSSVFENLSKLPDLATENRIFHSDPEKAGFKTSSTSVKINNSMSENISGELDVISTNSKSLGIEENNKKTEGGSFTTNSNRRSHRQLGKCITEMRTKRLAAAIARKKLAQNFQSCSVASSSDETSDSLDHHSVAEKDSLPDPYLNASNHSLFVDIEKVLFDQNSFYSADKNEFLSSKSESENIIVDSASECSEGFKEKNCVMEDLNRSSASKSRDILENLRTSATAKVSDCITEGSNSIESPSVLEKFGCKSFSASTKINDSMAEELSNAQIHMALESFSASEKLAVEEPPDLTLEPSNVIKNSENEMPPELSLPHLITDEEPGNEMLPIIIETKTVQDLSVVEELNNDKNGSTSETFSVFEKITETSDSTEKYSIMNRRNNEETHCHMEDCQNAENPENDGSSQQIDNFHVEEIEADENILENFHMRQVRYAIKAKINLPGELQKIEEEAWLSHRLKSSRKYKYKSSHKEAEIPVSSSAHHQIVSGNEKLLTLLKSTHHDYNKYTHSKQDVTEFNNKFNPFCQPVFGSPKNLFKVTEYALPPYDKKICFNKICEDVLRNVMDPYSLKHLDMREDGSLFLNWNKAN